MLNKQHQFAQRIISPDDRSTYKAHMCGLCHALGDSYGLISRSITSHEMILLNILISAQRKDKAEIMERRCPLNPFIKPMTITRDSNFSAAVAVELFNASVEDDLQDTKGFEHIKANLYKKTIAKKHENAQAKLKDYHFDLHSLDNLSAEQQKAELDDKQDPLMPSALASASLFEMTANLTDNAKNKEYLSAIGYHYGAYVYLLDAYRDFTKDMRNGTFTPLRRFSIEEEGKLTLTEQGLNWLVKRFEILQHNIQENAQLLTLHHSKQLVMTLLREPIIQIINQLSKIIERKGSLVYKQWQNVDVLRAATFLLPIAVSAGLAQTAEMSQCNVTFTETGVVPADCGDTIEGIGGVLGALVVGWCLCQSTGGMRAKPTGGGGYSVSDESFCDVCCMDNC